MNISKILTAMIALGGISSSYGANETQGSKILQKPTTKAGIIMVAMRKGCRNYHPWLKESYGTCLSIGVKQVFESEMNPDEMTLKDVKDLFKRACSEQHGSLWKSDCFHEALDSYLENSK